MYSNERGSRFNFVDLLVKIIFFALFVLVLMWLFSSKMPNLTPFYSNVFRENIKYMQEAGKSYFTTDKMPTEIGGESKITLAEMFEKKLILPFVDEDGNSCNQYESYVSIIKRDGYYELKTNLVCNEESDYVIEIIGCYDYCEDDDCEKQCTPTQIVEYQYKKPATKTKTTYSCDKGYKLKGKYCYKTSVVDTKSAEVTKTTTKTITQPAETKTIPGKQISLNYIKTKNDDISTKVYVSRIATPVYTTKKEYVDAKITEKTTTEKVYVTVNTRQVLVPGESYTYDCSTTKTEKQCTTTYKKENYKCNCTTYEDYNGNSTTTCNTCTRSIPVETCDDVTVPVKKTCTGTKPGTYKTVYSCPSIATDSSGSGSSLKCWYNKKVITDYTYSCPAIATHKTGNDTTLKCYYIALTEGGYSYRCPNDATHFTGSGSNLKCYKYTDSTTEKYCKDSTYKLVDGVCKKTIKGTFTELKCDKGYTLEGKVCNKYKTEKVKADSKKTTVKTYTYKWSEKDSLSGWTKTGKTRVKEGELTCK